MSAASAIAAQILADRERRPTADTSAECFSCGRAYIYKRPNDSGRFCSARCRDWFDTSNPSYEDRPKPQLYTLAMGKHGFIISCRGCAKDFDSKGLAFCSTECQRSSARRVEAQEIMAEVGMDVPAKRMCEAPGCSQHIPRWRGGRAVAKSTRFCSSKCGQSARKAARSRPPDQSVHSHQKPA